MKLTITVRDSCNTPSPPSPTYRPYSGGGNNIRNPTWGSVGARYRKYTDEYHDRDYYAHWGTDSDFSDLLEYCNEKARDNELSYLEGGGGTPYLSSPPTSPFAPPRDNFWAFGDPVRFCQNYLVSYINASDAPSGLTQEALDNAPVLPYPREVSNILFSQRQKRTSAFTNDLATYFAMLVTIDVTSQFVDRTWPTVVPWSRCDKWYDQGCGCCADPAGDYNTCVLASSDCHYGVGRLGSLNADPISEDNPRVYYDENSHFLDLSMIYGTDDNHMGFVSTEDPAKLTTNATMSAFPFFFGNAAGRGDFTGMTWDFYPDIRMNKSPPMNLLGRAFRNNHNTIADKIRRQNPSMDDSTVFEEARRVNIGQYQDVVFREYLGALFGRPLNPYDTNEDGQASSRPGVESYNPILEPNLDLVFSVAAYRFGHTKIPTILARRDRFFDDSEFADVPIRNCWWNISINSEYATSPEDIIRGLVSTRQTKTGAAASDDVRNLMFDEINKGEDLMAINIFRGREVGLPPLNAVREAYGLEPYISCANITEDPRTLNAIYRLYGNDTEGCLDRIDLFVAGVSEDTLEGSSFGETFYAVAFDTFTRLRNGDRYYYENQLGQETAIEEGIPLSYNPKPFNDDELADIYETSFTQILTNAFDDFQEGDLDESIFFTNGRQLQTLESNGQLVVTNESDPTEFELSKQLSPSYLLEWRLDNDVLTIRMTVGTLGWVGFGLEPDANTMKNADIYFCQVIDGVGLITDRYALDVGPPTLDTDLNGEDNIIDFFASEVDGSTVCQFSRRVNTGDNNWDKVIENRLMKTMFAFNPETDDLVYHGPTRQSDVFINFYDTLPSDEVPDAILIAMAVLAGLGILFAFIIIIVIFLKDTYFRLMSPMFCQLICVGSMLCFGAVLTLVKNNPPNEASCTAYPWLLGVGFMIMYGCLFAKTWRLYRVINSSMKMKSKVITNTDVMTMIVLFTVPMIIFLIVWTAVDGFDVLHEFTDDKQDETRDICDTPVVWWAIYVAFIGLILLGGSVLTFLIRNLPEEFNDSEAIGFSIYNALLMLVVGAGIGWGLDDIISAVVAIQGFAVLVFAWFTLVVLFVPTLYRLATGGDPRQFKSQVGTLNTGAGGSTNIGGGTSINE